MANPHTKFQEVITSDITKPSAGNNIDSSQDKNNTYTQKARESVRQLIQQVIAASISGNIVPPNNRLQGTLGHTTVNIDEICGLPTECSGLKDAKLSAELQEITQKWYHQAYTDANALIDEVKRMVTHNSLSTNDTYTSLQKRLQNHVKSVLTSTAVYTQAQQIYFDTILEYLGLEKSQSYREQPLPVKIFLSSINPEWELSKESVNTKDALQRLRGPKK